MSVLDDISQAVVEAESEEAVRGLVQKALSEGYPVKEIIDDGLIAGINIIGQRWQNGEAFIPEVLMSAEVMKAGTRLIKESGASSGTEPVGKVVIGTVKDDVHNIGKALVGMMLESCGFEVWDLGVDVAPEKFVETVKSIKPDILAMSALLTTTMAQMSITMKKLKEEGISVTTMVGGAPVTQEYAESIGANIYAPDAISAVRKAQETMQFKKLEG